MLMPKININDNMSEDEMILEFKKSMIDFTAKMIFKIITNVNIDKNIIDIMVNNVNSMFNEIIEEFKSRKMSFVEYINDIDHFNRLYNDLKFKKAIYFSEYEMRKKYPFIDDIVNGYITKIVTEIARG